MSQKFTKLQNKNDESTAYGKWFATAVYDQHFIETEELANYIQQQASVKKSDIKAVLDELGGAMKHYFELGQKVKLEGIGIFKVRVVVGQTVNKQGKITQKYVIAKTLVKDVVFEETYDTSLKPETSSGSDAGDGGNG